MKTTLSILIALAIVGASFGADFGPFRVSTAATSGTHEDDTLFLPEAYFLSGGADIVGMYLYVSKTTDGGNPLNDACKILAVTWTQSAYNIILDQEVEGAGNDASLGLSASITQGDYVMIISVPPSTAELREVVTGTFPTSGVKDRQVLQYLADSLRKVAVSTDTIHAYLSSATGAQWGTAAEPANGVNLFEGLGFAQNQLDSIVGATYGAVGSQWTEAAAEPAAGVAFMQGFHYAQNQLDSIVGAFYGDVGLQWGTATEPAAGVALDEAFLFLQNQADSIAGSLYGAVGLGTDPTGLFHANGVNAIERLNFIQDSLRLIHPFMADLESDADTIETRVQAIHTQMDSLKGYIMDAVGAQWGTAAEPANGVNLFEGVGFLQNQMDTVTTVKLEYAEQMQEDLRDSVAVLNVPLYGANGLPALTATKLTAAGGVSLGEGNLYMQNVDDSMRVEITGASGIADWSVLTSTKPGTNGASIAEGQLYDHVLLDTLTTIKAEYAEQMIEDVRDSLEDANDLLQKFNGVTTGFVDENIWTTVEVIVNFAAAGAWEEAASTHELFTVTGDVEFEISAFCSTLVAVTSADSIAFGAGDGAATFMAGANVYAALGTDIDAGEGLFRGVGFSAAGVIPTAGQLIGSGGVWHGTSMGGNDIGFDIDDNDFTGGIIVFYCRWRPITTGGSVAAGTGGAL